MESLQHQQQQQQEVEKVQEESPHVPNLSLTQELAGDNNDFVRSYLAQQQQTYQQQIEIKHQVMSQFVSDQEQQMPASTEVIENLPQHPAKDTGTDQGEAAKNITENTDEKTNLVEEVKKTEQTPVKEDKESIVSSVTETSHQPATQSMQKTETPVAEEAVVEKSPQKEHVEPAQTEPPPKSPIKEARTSPRKSPRGSVSVVAPAEPEKQVDEAKDEKDSTEPIKATIEEPQVAVEAMEVESVPEPAKVERESEREREPVPEPEPEPEPEPKQHDKVEREPETGLENDEVKSQDEKTSKIDSSEVTSSSAKADDSPSDSSASKVPRPKRKWGSSRTERPQRQGITTGELNNLLPSKEKVSRMASQDETAGSSGDLSGERGHEESNTVAGNVPRGSSETSASNTTFSGKFSGNTSADGGHDSGTVVSVTEGKTVPDLDSNSNSANGSAIASKVHLSPSESNDVSQSESKGEKEPTPAKNPASPYIFISNLTRPFTLKALQMLLSKFGNISTENFWIDKIKSKCIVQYDSIEISETARKELHGFRWPDSNPKTLSVEFSSLEELNQYKLAEEEAAPPAPPPSKSSQDRGRSDSRAAPTDKFDVVLRSTEDENENEPNKRQIREWDKDKVRGPSSPKRSRRSSGNEKGNVYFILFFVFFLLYLLNIFIFNFNS